MNRSGARRVVMGPSPVVVDTLIVVAVVASLMVGWNLLARPVTVTVDGVSDTLRSRRATVGALVSDLGIELGPLDHVLPPPETRLARGAAVTIERARPLRILADGRDFAAQTWGATVGEAFADAGLAVDQYDRAQLLGAEVPLDTPLPPLERSEAPVTWDRGFAWEQLEQETLQLRLRRAVPITVDEGGAPYTIRTTAPTVGEALRQADVTLYLGDIVEPSLGSSVTAGLRVTIGRSVPVSLEVDGKRKKTRTQAQTVGDALSNLEIVAAGLDIVQPPLDTPLFPDIRIRVTRVREEIEVEEQIEPFETVFRGDGNLAIDTQQVLDAGAEGITRQRYRVRYENGEIVSRTLEDEWLAQAPAMRIIAYGQNIQPQTAVVDGQSITYWRKIQMLATSYTAESAGGNRTRTGDLLRPGIVAVDPRLIPLRSRVFVPTYGFGDALDTGGGIISRRIDLAFDSANFRSYSRWLDVYLLWPPPDASQITWVVPNYPRVPGS